MLSTVSVNIPREHNTAAVHFLINLPFRTSSNNLINSLFVNLNVLALFDRQTQVEDERCLFRNQREIVVFFLFLSKTNNEVNYGQEKTDCFITGQTYDFFASVSKNICVSMWP